MIEDKLKTIKATSELQKNLQNVEYNLSTSVQLQSLLDENVCRTSWRHEEVEDKKPLR